MRRYLFARSLLNPLAGSQRLIASIIYSSGLRRIERVRLRVQDVDCDLLQLKIWHGKDREQRLTTLAPERVKGMQRQILTVN